MKRIAVAVIALALCTGAAYTNLASSKVICLNSAVTQIPRLITSRGIGLQNRGPNSIFVGWGVGLDGGQPYYPDGGPVVTATDGIEIVSGGFMSFDLSGRVAMWCQAKTADQVDGSETQIAEAR